MKDSRLMKMLSHFRGKAGATMSLVAGFVVILAAIGTLFFYCWCLISGNNQLNNATDAGVLAAAQEALSKPTVNLADSTLPSTNPLTGDSLSYTDLYIYADQKDSAGHPLVDILAYNKCVAHAAVVGYNASVLGTTAAYQHASDVATAVNNIGTKLQAAFIPSGTRPLDGTFTNIANNNPLNILNLAGKDSGSGSGANLQQPLQVAYLPGPTNIYLHPNSFTNSSNPDINTNIFTYTNPSGSLSSSNNGVSLSIPVDNAPGAPVPPVTAGVTLPQGWPNYYMAGGKPIVVAQGTAYQTTMYATATFPSNADGSGGKTHLIDPERFNKATTPPSNTVPPNAFLAASSSMGTGSGGSTSSVNSNSNQNNSSPIGTGPGTGGSTSGPTTYAVASAVVGGGSGSLIAPPAIQQGYVGLVNGGPMPATPTVFDGSNTFFDSPAAWPSSAAWVSPPTVLPSHPNAGAVCLFTVNLDAAYEWWRMGKTAGYDPRKPGAETVTVNFGKKVISKTTYDGFFDPLHGIGDSVTNHAWSDAISPRIRIGIIDPDLNDKGKQKRDANGNLEWIVGPVATVADCLAVGSQYASGSPNYSWSEQTLQLLVPNDPMTTRAQVKAFIGALLDPDTTVTKEMNALVNASGTINSVFYPIIDQAIADPEQPEPAYVDAILPIVTDFYAAQGGLHASVDATNSKFFPNGVDCVNWAKLEVMRARKDHNAFTLAFPYATDGNGNSLGFASTGMLYYPAGRVGLNAFKQKPTYDYVIHYALYATQDAYHNLTPQGSSYAVSGTPAQLAANIDMTLNGPVPYTPDSTNNGYVDLSSSNNHTFNPNQTSFATLVADLTSAMQKVNPNFGQSDVLKALGFNNINSQPGQSDFYAGNAPMLGLGQTVYMYADPNNPNSLICSATCPYVTGKPTPESDPSQWFSDTTGWYMVAGKGGQTYQDLQYNSLINTARDNKYAMRGDDNFHKACWKLTDGTIQALDQAVWQPATGSQNFLGQVVFQTNARVTDKTGTNVRANGMISFGWTN